MHAIRSVLWIGPASGLAASGALDCPRLDVTWVPGVADARALAPATFDVVVLDAVGEDAHRMRADLERGVGRPDGAPVLVRVGAGGAACEGAPETADWLAAGAAALLRVEPGASGKGGLQTLLARIDRLADERPWSDPERLPDPELPGVVGRSRAIREVCALAARARDSLATVLVSGETGTGKEVIARALHTSGPRAARPFVAVNCAAFPDGLLESELFGHVRGAFTGADRDKPGLFVEADGGTLFLDEIGETAPPLQATLLRVLQEREVRPVGSARSRPVDVRVVAATNRDLRDEAARGAFRDDLYYRLAVFPITVPPLRARRDDVLPLAEHFLARHGQRDGKPGCRLSHAAAQLLLAHDWPGNVRELDNEMQRALALAPKGGLVTPKHLSPQVAGIALPVQRESRPGDTLRANLDRVEAWLIRRALDQHGGRRAATARKLGITREGLYKKMKRLGIG